jgi:hypothetical protein
MHYVSRLWGQDKISPKGDKIRYDQYALGKIEGTEFRKPKGSIPLPQPNHEREGPIRGSQISVREISGFALYGSFAKWV